MLILAIIYTARGGGTGSSHSIHKAKEVGSQTQRGSVLGMQDGNFANEPGWDHGSGHVALCTITN